MVVWLIGLSGAGKTTLATEIVARVNSKSVNTVLLDGDVIREVLVMTWATLLKIDY